MSLTADPRIALVFCPYFSVRSPHLGFSRVYTALLEAGIEPAVHDLDTELKHADRSWYDAFVRANNIGLEFERVTFVLGLEVMLYTLFGNDFPDFDWNQILEKSPIRYVEGFHERVESLARQIISESPDYVLFSTYSSNILFSMALACQIKRTTSCRIVFGGPGCGILPTAELLLRTGFVDAVVFGEGEAVVEDLIKGWWKSKEPPSLPGVARISNDRLIYQPAVHVEDLDSLPWTRYAFGDDAGSYIPFETSRGCIMNCGFCSEQPFWKQHRMRSVDSVVAELSHHESRHGPLLVEFSDSMINPDRKRLQNLLEGIRAADLKSRWICDLRIAPWIDGEIAEAAFDAGCRDANVGAETFIPERLTYLRKGTRVEWILETIRALTAAGINTTVHRISSIGGENDAEILGMYDFLREFRRSIPDDRQWSRIHWGAPDILRIEPYSPMFNDPDRWGITLTPFSLPLPDGLSYMRASLDKICYRADNGIPAQEKLRRHALYKKLDRLTGLIG